MIEAYADGSASMPQLLQSSSLAGAGPNGSIAKEAVMIDEPSELDNSIDMKLGSQASIKDKSAGSGSRASIAISKSRKVHNAKRKKVTVQSQLSVHNADEEEFARLRESHAKSLAKNDSSMYIRRK